MSKRFTSILDELDHAPQKHRDSIIENRAHQVIASFANLVSLIEETYDAATAADLQKRLLNSVRSNDEEKFSRKMRQIKKAR